MSRNLTWCLVRNFTEKLCLLGFWKSARHVLSTQKYYTGYEINKNFDYHEVKSFKEFTDEKKISIRRVVRTLVKELNISKECALHCVSKWKILASLSGASIIENINILKDEDVNLSTIKANIYALADTTDNIKIKIETIKGINLEITSAIQLFKLPASTLKAFLLNTTNDKYVIRKYNSRIEYLMVQLQTNIPYLCTKLSSHSFLLTIHIQKIVAITNLLINSDIKRHHIVEDLLIYKYSIDRIKERVKRAKKAAIQPLRPWVVRCPIEILQNIECRLDNRLKLFKSCKTLEEYISHVMDCDIQVAQGLLLRNPNIKSINVINLTSKLKMLREFGYTMNDIFSVPRIFHCKNSTLRKKYNEWKSHHTKPPPLFVLYLSDPVLKNNLGRALKYHQIKQH